MDSKSLEPLYVADRAAWRAWLEQHHASSTGVRLAVNKKGSRKPGVDYEEAVEEALCFGWIDHRANRLDDDQFTLQFSPRKPGGVWAQSNKRRVEKLTAEGKMTPVGLAMIEEARKNGAWDRLNDIDDLLVPQDLAAALDAEPAAKANFLAFSSSARKMILGWIAQARRPETRARRIAETAARALQNQKPV